jgi:hypothetical protein
MRNLLFAKLYAWAGAVIGGFGVQMGQFGTHNQWLRLQLRGLCAPQLDETVPRGPNAETASFVLTAEPFLLVKSQSTPTAVGRGSLEAVFRLGP